MFPFGTSVVSLIENDLRPRLHRCMLQQMPQTATPSLPPQSFARLMADLAAPAPDVAERALAWNDDELEDDVATLSYERALRARGRYLEGVSADPTDRSLLQPAELRPGPIHDGEDSFVGGHPDKPEAAQRSLPFPNAGFQTTSTVHSPISFENNLKSASITIRLSEVESVQLRQRAAEAGLTISAYLRSCTFEAESLRAQVKEALAQLRSAPSSPADSNAKKTAVNAADPSSSRSTVSRSSEPRRSLFEWLWAILPPWHSRQRAVRA
jgi:hypothetical protein